MKTIKKFLKAAILLSVVICMLSGISLAQEQFRLSDYKNPDYRWQRLDLGFALGGNNSFYKQKYEGGITSKTNVNNFNSGLDIDYYATKNSEFYQGYQDFWLVGDVSSNWNSVRNVTDDLGFDQKSNNQNINLGAQTVNRFYDKRKRFAEIDFYLGSGLYNSVVKNSADQEELPYLNKSTHYEYRLSASLPLLIGKGRIEDVQDARLAVYILDDLTKSGDLKRVPTREEILAFSRFITQTKNQRFFDSRIRKIAEITAIDSFLTVLDLKAQSDASYFTLLNDNWDNANGPVRRTGSRFSIGLVPDIDLFFIGSKNYYRDTFNNPDVIESYTNKNNTRSDSWGLDFVAKYAWEKPASLYWQHTVNADLAYSLYYKQVISKIYDMDILTYEQKSRLNSPNLKLQLGYAIGFYPNSRTNIRLGANTILNQYWGDEKINDDLEIDAGKILVNSGLYLSCYYYISPQLRFSLNINSTYSFTKKNRQLPEDVYGEKNSHYLHNSIGASLTYSIF
jgi:hypothetical protein